MHHRALFTRMFSIDNATDPGYNPGYLFPVMLIYVYNCHSTAIFVQSCATNIISLRCVALRCG